MFGYVGNNDDEERGNQNTASARQWMWARACSNLRGRYHSLNHPLRCREAQSRAQEQIKLSDNSAPPRNPVSGPKLTISRGSHSRAENQKLHGIRLSKNKQT